MQLSELKTNLNNVEKPKLVKSRKTHSLNGQNLKISRLVKFEKRWAEIYVMFPGGNLIKILQDLVRSCKNLIRLEIRLRSY